MTSGAPVHAISNGMGPGSPCAGPSPTKVAEVSRTPRTVRGSVYRTTREEGSEEAKGAAYDAATDRGVLDHIRGILRRGQEGGEFREFDTLVMAAAIQRSLNGLPLLLRTDPGLDLAVCAEELVTLFDLATRARETP